MLGLLRSVEIQASRVAALSPISLSLLKIIF
jgi:hypothetical protein